MLLTKNPLPLVVGEVRVLFFRFIELRLDLKRKEIVKKKENKICHTVQKLIVISNKLPRTFDSILFSYVINAY